MFLLAYFIHTFSTGFIVRPIIQKSSFFTAFIMSFIIIVVIFLILLETYARLSYKFWLYEFTPTELRLERGIIWKRYSNVPYERVQNIDVTRGILARLFGFSSLNIQTAGYSAYRGHSSMAEGYIPAVELSKAEEIRNFVMKKISKSNKGM